MKKKVLGVITFAAIVAVAGWNYTQNLNKIDNVELSDLVLENVEALAGGEVEVGVPCIMAPITCYVIDDEFGTDIIVGYNQSFHYLITKEEVISKWT